MGIRVPLHFVLRLPESADTLPGRYVVFTPSGISASPVWGHPILVHATPTARYDNDVSTKDTIDRLRFWAHQSAGHPLVQRAIGQAVGRLGSRTSKHDLACAIFYWVRDHVQFIEDEPLLFYEFGVPPEDLDQELIIPPPALLSMPQPMGDCDDFSLLTACMCLGAGIRPYYVTIAADSSEPQRWSHIYVCVRTEEQGSGKHLCLDPGNRYVNIPPGWETSAEVFRKRVWPV